MTEQTRELYIRDRIRLLDSNTVSLSKVVEDFTRERIELSEELAVIRALARSAGSAARETPGASTEQRT